MNHSSATGKHDASKNDASGALMLEMFPLPGLTLGAHWWPEGTVCRNIPKQLPSKSPARCINLAPLVLGRTAWQNRMVLVCGGL